MVDIVDDKVVAVDSQLLLHLAADAWENDGAHVELVDDAAVLLAVVEGTLHVAVAPLVRARHRLVYERVILLLFPSVAHQTACLIVTPLLVATDESVLLPVRAQLKRIVLKLLWLSSEVLPIVRIVTY